MSYEVDRLGYAAICIDNKTDKLRGAIERETQFGVGATFRKPREHAVMEADWSVSPITHMNRDKAWKQLGTSGSGNHFVEFGTLTSMPISA